MTMENAEQCGLSDLEDGPLPLARLEVQVKMFLDLCSKSPWKQALWPNIPVCRVWAILTRSWVRQSRTSGAGAQKPCKNRQVHH